MLNKRGQITLFIIIGMVILAIVGIALYLNFRTAAPASVSEVVPEEAAPVKVYVEGCLNQLAARALVLAGEQGGYVDADKWAINYRPNNPTDGTGVYFTSLVPYWFFLDSDNDCTGSCAFSTRKPNLYKTEGEPSIQGQVELYITENLAECLNGFDSFQQYTVTETAEPQLSSEIGSRNIRYTLKLPLDIEIGDTKSKISNFMTDIDIALPGIYSYSEDLTSAQRNQCFLEHHALEMINVFSGAESERLPPMTDMRFDSKGTTWLVGDTRDHLEQVLQGYTGLLQAYKSLNFHEIKVPDTVPNSGTINRMYSNMIIPLSAPDYNVYLTYLDSWPIYFDIGRSGLIRPNSYVVPFLGLGMQKYEFNYDLSWPVVVEVNDPKALNGQGYSFKFALEGNIRNNQCLETDFNPIEASAINGASMLCNENQKNSGLINFNVIDEEGSPVSAAYLTFTSDDSCPIGATDESGALSERLPVAIGYLDVEHPDYLAATKTFATNLDEDQNVDIILQKSRLVKFMLLKKNLYKQPRWSFNNWELPLLFSEEAMITLDRVGEEYSTAGMYNGSMAVNQEFGELLLYPGEYDVSIIVYSYNPLYIPPSSRKVGSFFNEETIRIPEVRMESWQSGGLEFTEYSGRWKVTGNDLDRVKFIKFFAVGINQPDVSVIEDLDQLGAFETNTKNNRAYLEPEVVINEG